ncbi:hypothetical protein Glove_258g45 [Diversispora epigaea]|uniref:Uncharacterized protein n=1 Tax=Diversispora epigaea TaxID=1348612 RepID=A0A397IF89_9GLOM|nr:hypothetical protein Glove_258g45 [Diversispora epigaea]
MSYKIKSGPKFSKFKDPKKLPNNAKFFLPIHRKALNINYKNVYTADEIINSFPDKFKIDNDLLVSNFTREDLLSTEPGSFILEKLNNNKEKSLAIYFNEVLFNDQLTEDIQETLMNTFVDYFFRTLRFDEYPLSMKLQPNFRFRIFKYEVSAKVEFSVVKNKVTLCINEDKYIHTIHVVKTNLALIQLLKFQFLIAFDSINTKYGESQISAEILACAFTNFNSTYSSTYGKNQMIYATRVIGTRFTFYKAFLNSKYFKSLGKGSSVVCELESALNSQMIQKTLRLSNLETMQTNANEAIHHNIMQLESAYGTVLYHVPVKANIKSISKMALKEDLDSIRKSVKRVLEVKGRNKEGGIKHENMPTGSYAFYMVKIEIPFSTPYY